MVEENLIRAGAGGELAIGRDRHGVDWVESLRQWLPLDRTDDVGGSICSLIDPEFDEAEFLGSEIGGLHLVGRRRHDGVLELVRGCFQQQTRSALLRGDGWSGVAAFAQVLGRFQHELGFGGGLVVTREAIVF